MTLELHPFSFVSPTGYTLATKSFYNFREAANGFGLTDYLVEQGYAVLQIDLPQPPHQSIT